MALGTLDRFVDQLHSPDEQPKFERDLVVEVAQDQVVIDLRTGDMEKRVRAAHLLGEHVLKDPVFNMDIEVGATSQIHENDPYRRLGSLSLS